MSNGLILGRFLPPHAGHLLLAETARALCERLTILVCWSPADPIPAPARIGWCRELFPFARVIACEVSPEAAPEMAAGILPVRAEQVRAAHPEPIDRLFTSRPAEAPLASALGARMVLLDAVRATVRASGRAIRAAPWAHWPVIPPPVRPHYARTICLHGPESTGKSTLAPLIARHFDTIHVPEYGRTYCEQYGLTITMEDLVAIGRTHAAITDAALRQCNRRLILDTDPLMTAAWADMLFGRRDPWFDRFAGVADLYLLLDLDLPWVDDGTRFFGQDAERRRFFDLSRAELDRRGLPYVIIGGPPERRLERALDAIAAAGLG